MEPIGRYGNVSLSVVISPFRWKLACEFCPYWNSVLLHIGPLFIGVWGFKPEPKP